MCWLFRALEKDDALSAEKEVTCNASDAARGRLEVRVALTT